MAKHCFHNGVKMLGAKYKNMPMAKTMALSRASPKQNNRQLQNIRAIRQHTHDKMNQRRRQRPKTYWNRKQFGWNDAPGKMWQPNENKQTRTVDAQTKQMQTASQLKMLKWPKRCNGSNERICINISNAKCNNKTSKPNKHDGDTCKEKDSNTSNNSTTLIVNNLRDENHLMKIVERHEIMKCVDVAVNKTNNRPPHNTINKN